jgi:hypothetical protein
LLKETSLIWRVLLQENTETGSTGYGNPGTDGADGKGPITDGNVSFNKLHNMLNIILFYR